MKKHKGVCTNRKIQTYIHRYTRQKLTVWTFQDKQKVSTCIIIFHEHRVNNTVSLSVIILRCVFPCGWSVKLPKRETDTTSPQWPVSKCCHYETGVRRHRLNKKAFRYRLRICTLHTFLSETVLSSAQKGKKKRIWTHEAPWLSYLNLCQHQHCTLMTDCAVCQPHPEPRQRNRDNKSTAGLNVCTDILHIKSSAFTLVKRHQSNMLAERARPQRISSFFVYLQKKETDGWDVHGCVITRRVCIALTNLIQVWAAKTPVPYSTSWCDKPIITLDYPELPSLCFFPLSFPAIT